MKIETAWRTEYGEPLRIEVSTRGALIGLLKDAPDSARRGICILSYLNQVDPRGHSG